MTLYNSPGTADEINLDAILSGITRLTSDPSAVSNGWQTLELFSAVIATNTTTTGATVSIKASSSQTIFVDITGQLVSGTAASTGATASVMTLRAGLSGFGFITLRQTTAGLGQFAWKVAAAGVTSGATADTTGATRFDDMFLQVLNPTTLTGGSITVRARLFLSPEF